MIQLKKIIIVVLIFLSFFTRANAELKDALYATVGNKAITQSDLVNEVKLILILTNRSYSADIRDQLRATATNALIKRSIKEIEIERIGFLEYNKKDFYVELERLAAGLNVDLETFKNICSSNGLDFSIIENNVKTELLWNSVIFQIYKDRLIVSAEEIEDQLKQIGSEKKATEYLISEIVIRPVEQEKLENEINDLINKIEVEGFEKVAMDLSISDTALKGGDLGWVNENVISQKFRSKIINTSIGNLSDPILLPEGILLFKVRDKRQVEKKMTLEETKKKLVGAEKTKILRMFSMSHYDNLRRTIAVDFFTNE